MALRIKTEKADRLARELAQLTGETMTTAVTVALEERLRRERAARDENLIEKVRAFVERTKDDFDWSRPVTREASDELWEPRDISSALAPRS
jgi:antitoxin VapB